MHFFHELTIFWSAKKQHKDTFFPTLQPLSPVTFATASVVAFVLLRNSRFNFCCYTHREATPTQKSARKWRCNLSRLLARKITKGIHSCKPASQNHPTDSVMKLYMKRSVYALKQNMKSNSAHTDPIICAPRRRSVFLSPRTLTKPSVSLLHLARLLASRGKVPTLYSTPCRRNKNSYRQSALLLHLPSVQSARPLACMSAWTQVTYESVS